MDSQEVLVQAEVMADTNPKVHYINLNNVNNNNNKLKNIHLFYFTFHRDIDIHMILFKISFYYPGGIY